MPVVVVPEGSRDAVDEFHRDLEDDPEIRVIAAQAGIGRRGGVAQLITDPVGVSGIMAIVRVVSLWLRRDRDRSVTIKRSTGEDGDNVVITGENVSLTTLESAIRAALEGERSSAEAGSEPERPPDGSALNGTTAP